jgi:hypothetical protein
MSVNTVAGAEPRCRARLARERCRGDAPVMFAPGHCWPIARQVMDRRLSASFSPSHRKKARRRITQRFLSPREQQQLQIAAALAAAQGQLFGQ